MTERDNSTKCRF